MIKLIIFLLTHNRAIKEGGRGERAIKSIHCWRGTNGCLGGKKTNKITICKTQIKIHGTKVCLEGKTFMSVLFKLLFASLENLKNSKENLKEKKHKKESPKTQCCIYREPMSALLAKNTLHKTQ